MVKFIKVAFKLDMLQVEKNGKPTWVACSADVKKVAKTLNEGQNVELTVEQQNGKDFVTFISRPGESGKPSSSQGQSAETPKPVSQSTPSTGIPNASFSTSKYGQKSPEESEKITRLSVMSSASNAVQVFTGQITDPAVLADAVITVYTRMLAEIKK